MSTDIYGEYGLPEPEKRYRVPEATVRAHLEALEAYGFTREDIRAMVKRIPSILRYTARRTNALLANLEAYSFTREDIRAMVKRIPSILCYTAGRTNALLANLETYGFTREDIRVIVKRQPSIFCYTAGRTNALLANLGTHDFAREDIRSMVKMAPSILSYTAGRTGTNLATLSIIGIDALSQPALLMLAPDHLKGRVVVLMRRGITPQASLMGMRVKVWEERFGLTRDETVAQAESFSDLFART